MAGPPDDPAEDAERPGSAQGTPSPGTTESPKSVESAESTKSTKSTKSAESSEDAEGAEGGSGGGNDRLRAAVAAWVATADEDGADADAESAKNNGNEAGTTALPGPGKKPADGGAGNVDAKTDIEDGATDATEREASAKEREASAEADSLPDPLPGAGTDAGTGTETGRETGRDVKPDAEPDSEPVTEPEPAAKSGPDAPPAASDAEATPKEPKAPKPTATERPTSAPEPPSAEEPAKAPTDEEPTPKAPKAAEAPKAPEPAAPPVDNATTAFKVLRPPLDQPTKALKKLTAPAGPSTPLAERPATDDRPSPRPAAGAAAKPGTADKPATTGNPSTAGKPSTAGRPSTAGKPSTTGAAPEAEAERTSTFVPLRPLDDRAATKGTGAREERPAPKWADPQKADPQKADPRKPAAQRPGTAPSPSPRGPAAPGNAAPGPAAAAAAAVSAPGSASTTDEIPQTATVGPDHTRQQQLPPKPPLDLLAELTNTPPPPETPLRTTVRRVKIWTPLVILLLIVFCVVQTFRPLPKPSLALTASDTFSFGGAAPQMPWPAKGQAAMDVDGLGTFGTSGEQKPVPIASVAKVMTAYIVLRDHPVKAGSDGVRIPMDQKAEDDAGLSAQNESTVDVKAGQKLTQKEAIEAIMIASANNIARQLARWDAGSEKAFVEKMNKTADELGMKNTTYTDPSGLDKTTVSTAEDQVALGKKAMKDPLFREVVRMPSYTDSNGKRQGNWNQLVPMNNTVGIKTGTTTAAGGNLMYAATKDVGGTTRTVIGAVLAQPPSPVDNSILTGALNAGSTLIKAAQGELEAKKVVKKGDVVGRVDDGLGGSTPVVATKDVTAVGWSGLTVKLRLVDDGTSVPHEAKAGTKVGVLRVGDGTSGAVEVPVALQGDLSEPGFGAKLKRVG